MASLVPVESLIPGREIIVNNGSDRPSRAVIESHDGNILVVNLDGHLLHLKLNLYQIESKHTPAPVGSPLPFRSVIVITPTSTPCSERASTELRPQRADGTCSAPLMIHGDENPSRGPRHVTIRPGDNSTPMEQVLRVLSAASPSTLSPGSPPSLLPEVHEEDPTARSHSPAAAPPRTLSPPLLPPDPAAPVTAIQSSASRRYRRLEDYFAAQARRRNPHLQPSPRRSQRAHAARPLGAGRAAVQQQTPFDRYLPLYAFIGFITLIVKLALDMRSPVQEASGS